MSQSRYDASGSTKTLLAESADYIKGTTQSITFNLDGTIASIAHTGANSVIVRTDTFTYGLNTITEVRTLAGGATKTTIFHTDTYETEVI